MGITYDTGALIAAEQNSRNLWVLHARALQRGWRPIIPAAVLAQAWRGGPQAQLSRLVQGCHIEELDEARARAVGVACARSASRDILDATVVVGAIARGDLVVTSDPGDLQRIAAGVGARLALQRI